MLCLLGVLFSAHGGLVVRALFEVRQAYIAEHLCENRHHPERKCNGMCFLKKHLQETHDDAERSQVTPPSSTVAYFVRPAAPSTLLARPPVRFVYPVTDERGARDGYARSVDPPPRHA